MDKYKILKAVQGLVMSLDEQIYRRDQKNSTQDVYDRLVDDYYDAILKFLVKEGKTKEN